MRLLNGQGISLHPLHAWGIRWTRWMPLCECLWMMPLVLCLLPGCLSAMSATCLRPSEPAQARRCLRRTALLACSLTHR